MLRLSWAKVLVFGLIFLSATRSVSQSPEIDTTVVRLLSYLKQAPQEKVYLRTNKEVFTSGETLWFASYLVDAGTHTPRNLSSLLYVDLVNPGDTVISTLPVKLTNGVGSGDFMFADTLQEGIYHLRGYTNYMKNYPAEFMFTKPIKLLDYSSRTVTQEPTPEVKDIDIQFFPEGGNLIAGQLNYVAFKAIDERGKGIAIEGKIVDESGAEVGSFEPELLGMGKFQLNPERGKNYFAAYSFRGVSFSKALPEVENRGYLFNVRQTKDKIYLTLKGSDGVKVSDGFILGHTRGAIFTVIPGSPDQSFIYAPIPTNQVPSGIAHFTFFDGKGNPQSERLVFNMNGFENPDVEVNSTEESYGKRKKASFSTELKDYEGNPVDGNFSVSVLSKTLNESNKINIENYLLLSSDLKGTIERPNWYFSPENENVIQHLDLIMMTNGWRRFKWEDVLSQELPPVEFYPETGFSVEGQVVKYLSRNVGVKGKVTMTFLENPLFNREANSEDDGIFWFDDLKVEDTLTAIIQTKRLKEKGGKYKETRGGTFISLVEKTPPKLDFQFLNPYEGDEEFIDFVDNNLKIRNIEAEFGDDVVVLDELKVEAQKDVREEPFYRESILYSSPDDRLVTDSLVAVQQYRTVFDMMRGRFPGVEIVGLSPNQTAFIRGFSSITLDNQALFLVDGIPTDASLVSQIPPERVEFIDVLKGPRSAIYSASGNGVIAIYLRRGPRALDGSPDPIGLITFTMNGYYPTREFYVPNYDSLKGEELIKPDYRTTLFWDHQIDVEEGKAEFDFFTSDESGKFMVYIEGLSKEGRIIKGEHEFEVR